MRQIRVLAFLSPPPDKAGPRVRRNPWHAFEVLSILAFLMVYIWELRPYWPRGWILVLVLILVSNLVHREGPASLGFVWKRGGAAARAIGPVVLAIAALGLAASTWAGTLRPVGIGAALAGLGVYCCWGLLQQYVINGFFANRLAAAAGGGHERAVALGTAVIFAVLHLPNALLMALTLPAGFLAALVYLRYRNLIVLGIAHGILGSLIYLAVPDTVSHHLYVGPKCIAYCRSAGHVHAGRGPATDIFSSVILGLR